MSFFDSFGKFAHGAFGNSGKPYDEAGKTYQDWVNKGATVNSPYYNAGTGAIGDYQDWLTGQKDPAKFVNNLLGQYNESPQAHYLQQQAENAGTNMGSASGLTGSSALAQQMQQNAGNIASGDMNKWLQNVLGINKQYGEGQHNLVNTGQNATNNLTNLYGTAAGDMGKLTYGKETGKQQDFWDMLSGLGGMFGFS